MQHCPRALVAPPPGRRRGARFRRAARASRRRASSEDASPLPARRHRARRERRRRCRRRHDGQPGASPGSASSVLGEITVTVGSSRGRASAAQLGLHAYLDRPLRAALAQGRTPRSPGRTSRSSRASPATRCATSSARSPRRCAIEPVDARFRLVKSVPRRRARISGAAGSTSLDATAAIAAGPAAARSRPGRAADEGRRARGHGALAAAGARGRPHAAPRLALLQARREAARCSASPSGSRSTRRRSGASRSSEAAQPWWYPPNSAWAAGEKPVPPGPGQPARHALDGHLVARRRPARHARRGLGRLQRLARLHPHAHPGRRVAVHARARRQPRVDHPLSDARPAPAAAG